MLRTTMDTKPTETQCFRCSSDSAVGFVMTSRSPKTLRNSAGHEINRVFIIYFPNRQAQDRIFDDEAYKEIRGRLFEPSVRDTTTIGSGRSMRSTRPIELVVSSEAPGLCHLLVRDRTKESREQT